MPLGTMKIDFVNHLVLKFNHKSDIHEEWFKDKEKTLESQEFRNCCLYEVKELRKRHEIFILDLASHQTRVRQIASTAQDLNSLGYHDVEVVNARSRAITDDWNRLLISTHQRGIQLKETEQVLEKIDCLQLDFAKRAVSFNNWLDGARQDLMDVFIVRFIKEIQDLVNACQQFKMKFLEADREHFAIVALSQEIKSIAAQYQIPEGIINPYTRLTAVEISSKWYEVKQLLPKRDPNLYEEHIREQINENLFRIFAEKANIVGPWIDRQIHSVAAIAMECYTTLEEQLSKLSQSEMAAKLYQTHMDELEAIHLEMKKGLQVLEDRYTHYTMNTLRIGWGRLMSSIERYINEVENQIEIRDSKGITAEELTRLRISFNQFDENQSGKLDVNQFMSCLFSLGFTFKGINEETIDSDMECVMNTVDPNSTGFVTFDEFLDFITDEDSDTECVLEMVKSFNILSSYKPYITAEDLHQHLNPDKAQYCIERMQAYDGPDTIPGALDYALHKDSLSKSSSQKSVVRD